MATRFTKIAAILFPIVWVSCASGQVSKPTKVKPTSELRSLVPKGNILRGAWHTNLTPSGETIFLYDDGEEVLQQACLAILRGGRESSLVDATYVQDFVLVSLDNSKKGLAVVSSNGEDGADAEFVIFVFSNGLYKRVFSGKTMEGQMKIVSTNPLSFTLSDAAEELDSKDNSCVWCPHRFRIKSYVWNGETFKLTKQVLTKEFIRPADPGSAFILPRPTPTANKH
ncbi:MAG TPA: hypothetical protein VKB26_14420 [Candidatus Acidoferrales bacterium]|nr:hypothetical protein [Candidatus Acidoferrales bacterium]